MRWDLQIHGRNHTERAIPLHPRSPIAAPLRSPPSSHSGRIQGEGTSCAAGPRGRQSTSCAAGPRGRALGLAGPGRRDAVEEGRKEGGPAVLHGHTHLPHRVPTLSPPHISRDLAGTRPLPRWTAVRRPPCSSEFNFR